MISFKEYRTKAISARELRTGNTHDPERRDCDAAFERVLTKRHKRMTDKAKAEAAKLWPAV